jgi:uncharacterized protein
MSEEPEKHFVIDSMLGKLAKWLRILGFDARCERLQDQHQVDGHRHRGVLLVTRNRRWSGQNQILFLTANDPMAQLREVVARIPLTPREIRLLQRCVCCNDRLRETAPDEVLGFVPDYVWTTQPTFFRCPKCLRVYWHGSHSERMMERLERELGWTMERTEGG